MRRGQARYNGGSVTVTMTLDAILMERTPGSSPRMIADLGSLHVPLDDFRTADTLLKSLPQEWEVTVRPKP